MRLLYLVGGGVNASSSTALWSPIDWMRNPTAIGLSVTFASGSSAVAWAVNVTMDDPTGTFPNPVLNPGYAPPYPSHGSSGAAVQSFGSSQVAGWGGQFATVLTSTAATPVSGWVYESEFCFGAGTGAVIGGITQPITALQLVSTSSGVALSILQAGPR